MRLVFFSDAVSPGTGDTASEIISDGFYFTSSQFGPDPTSTRNGTVNV